MENNDLKNNFSIMSREEKIKMLLDYARECHKNGYKPTKRGIRKNFHVEIYNYFKNIADYHRKAGITVSLRNYPKEEARRLIIEFLKNKAKDGIYLNRKEIEQALKIHLAAYFKNLKDIYENANVDYSLVLRQITKKILSSHTYSKEEIDRQKQLIRNFIKTSVAKSFYPSVQHIQKNLNLSFYNLYNDIFEAYKDAEVEYERPSPIILGKKKEKIFTKIVKELLIKMDFKILRVSIESLTNFNRYADMTIEDKNEKKYLVEIKAYRKDYSIAQKEFEQLSDYLKKENISNGIFITTSSTKRCGFSNIQLINGDFVMELLKANGLIKYIGLIEWIQNSRVNSKERWEYKEILKNKILNYVKVRNSIPTKIEIQQKFGVDLRSIFGKPRPYEKLIKEAEKLSTLAPRI